MDREGRERDDADGRSDRGELVDELLPEVFSFVGKKGSRERSWLRKSVEKERTEGSDRPASTTGFFVCLPSLEWAPILLHQSPCLFVHPVLIDQKQHMETYLRRSAALRRTRSARSSPVEEVDSS